MHALLRVLAAALALAACGASPPAPPGAADAPADAGAMLDLRPADAARATAVDVPLEPGSDFPVTLQQWRDGTLTPLGEGSQVEIVQGPQGGIHLEVVARLWRGSAAPSGAPIRIHLRAIAEIEGVVEGLYDVPGYLIEPAPGGAYQTSTVPVFLAETDAAVYAGKMAQLRFELTVDAATGVATAEVRLVDEQ